MVTAVAFYNLYEKLPDLVHRVLDHKEIPEHNIALGKKYHLRPEQQKQLVLNESAMIVQDYPPRQFIDHLKTDLHVDDVTARSLAADVLGYIFLPLEWFYGKLEPLIKDLGGDFDHYLTEAKKTFPEVYSPESVSATTTKEDLLPTPLRKMEADTAIQGEQHPVLHNFDERVGSFKGRAEVLLRLTGLSSEVEDAVKEKKMTEAQGEQLLKTLDGLSYAVNTKDLNALEIESLRRGIKKVLRALAKAQ